MTLDEQLKNFEPINSVCRHDASLGEVKQHIDTANRFLTDAQKKDNSLETRFTVAYSAGHNLLTAALKMKGYRTTQEKGHRSVLYQLLDTLLPAAASAKVVLSDAHNKRNRSEYDGYDIDVTQAQVEGIVIAVKM